MATRPSSSASSRRKKLSKPELGQLKNLPKVATIREFRLPSVDEYEVGQQLNVAEMFAAGDLVDVTGVSKGKGFAGHIKRHHFKRGPKTHGSDHHRAPGSIGPGTTPGRVYKGMKMAGHMGAERVTTKKLRVVRTDAERNLLLVKGSLPGGRNSLIIVKKA
jgi:large subunit ribosomal protein L3